MDTMTLKQELAGGRLADFSAWDLARASGCCTAVYAAQEETAAADQVDDLGDAAVAVAIDLARRALETPARTTEDGIAKLALAVDGLDRLGDLGDEDTNRDVARIRSALVDVLRVFNRVEEQNMSQFGCDSLAAELGDSPAA
jgi:hypothetical protein